MNLIAFNTLYDILNNVTLNLPEGYELAMGTKYHSLPWYVKHARAALLADSNNFMIIMYFPLTTVNRKYELYQMFAFPSRILNSTYASFQLDGNYLAISVLQQTYVSLTESDLSQCEGDMMKICPVNRAVSSTRSDICELTLYFQRQNVREVCYRTISARMPSPTLQRQGSVVVYYLPEARNAYFRCRDSQGWKSTNLMLDGAGTLLGVKSCHITVGNLQLYAEIRGEAQFEGPMPQVIYPSQFTVTSHNELEVLKKMAETQNMDELIAKISAQKMEANVDALVSLPSTIPPRTDNTSWMVPTFFATTVTLALLVLCYCAVTPFRKLLKRNTHPKTSEAPVNPNSKEDNPRTATTSSVGAPTTLQPEASSRTGFSTYAITNHPTQ